MSTAYNMSDNKKINMDSMREEFRYIYYNCQMNGQTEAFNYDLLRGCGNMMHNFDKKYGMGRYYELISWSGWISSYLK